MKNVRLFWWVLFLFAPVTGSLAETAQIQLLTDSETLSPTSTIEIRFPTAMVPKEAVGTVAEPVPIEISPALPGNFTWLSRRSGVFSISSAPQLGTRYVIRARAGLVDSEGKSVGQGWQTELETPAYMVTWTSVEGPEGTALPDVNVAFNLKTQLDPSVFRFVAPNQPPVAATVRYARANHDYFPRPPDAGDWEERWQNRNRVTETKETNDEPLQDGLVVTPVGALEPGLDWTLEIGPGVRSLDSQHVIESKKLVALKEIKPFTVEHLDGVNYIHSGKAIVIQFSNSVGQDIGSANLGQYVTIEPEVPGLKYELDQDTVRVRGDFQLGQTYRVKLSSELVDWNGLPISGDLVREVQIGPVKPRIYLPTALGDQYQDGRREFEILSVNLTQLHVRAKLIDPDATPSALEAFARYDTQGENEKPERTEDEPNKQVAERDFKGRVVFDQS
ncbi:MAG: hypothetical protein JO308_16160, partial [Verrucomicrobia bacterium]|nr:hypothetical protein [Verrucomicrobiota bacterium]